MAKFLPGFREANREAGKILSQKSNRLKLIEGLLFCVLFFFFSVFLGQTCWKIAQLLLPDKETLQTFVLYLGDGLFLGCQIFVCVPLFIGLLTMAARMANEEDVYLTDLFLPFRSWKLYARALIVFWPVFWKFVIFWVIPTLFIHDLDSLFGEGSPLSVLAWGFLFLLTILWLLLALFGFVRLSFLLQWRMPLWASLRANWQIAGKSFVRGGLWWLCFLPRILLGFLTVGILLIADVIPRMLISYFLYAGRMTDFVFSSEEPNNE